MEGLTGFKWIAKMVLDHPELEFIGGGEESYGFMVGDFVRDKDAVTSTLLACEAAAQLKARGLTMTDYLKELYEEFGTYRETLTSLVKKGKQGAEEIEGIMQQLRENPAEKLGGERVIRMEDYLRGTYTNLETGDTGTLELPNSNVLIYFTDKGSKVAARPSGTEPKIKFYISVNSPGVGTEVDNSLNQRISKIKTQLGI
jgi:phosphomannomutase